MKIILTIKYIDDFCKKHNINLTKKEIGDLADDIKEAAAEIAE